MDPDSVPRRGRSFKRGRNAARFGQAWRRRDGWYVASSDKYGPHTCRPATGDEVAGILAFYREYAPGLRVTA